MQNNKIKENNKEIDQDKELDIIISKFLILIINGNLFTKNQEK